MKEIPILENFHTLEGISNNAIGKALKGSYPGQSD